MPTEAFRQGVHLLCSRYATSRSISQAEISLLETGVHICETRRLWQFRSDYPVSIRQSAHASFRFPDHRCTCVAAFFQTRLLLSRRKSVCQALLHISQMPPHKSVTRRTDRLTILLGEQGPECACIWSLEPRASGLWLCFSLATKRSGPGVEKSRSGLRVVWDTSHQVQGFRGKVLSTSN